MSINDIFKALAGQRIAGGCDRCNAYQTMTKEHGIHVIHVHHDDWCPFLARYEGRATTRGGTKP